MFPSEMVVLMAIATTSKVYGNSDSHPADKATDYTSQLYESLIQRGYLQEAGAQRYRLTNKGRVVVRDFLRDNKTKVRDIMRTLKDLGIDTRIRPAD
jgi:hypothetical protein